MALIFKSGDELFDQGIDLIKRKEFAKAKSNFQKSVEKDGKNAEIANIYISIIDVYSDPNSADRLEFLASRLEATNIGEFEFGLTSIESKKFAVELRLTAERIRIFAMNGNSNVREEKGNKLLQLAQKFQIQIGNDGLKLNELISNDVSITGIRESLSIQALGYETLASAVVLTDPKKAAEMLQNAYNYRRQTGEDVGDDMNLIKAYSKTAKCWICGRSTTGEGIHFITMSSEITPFMRTEQDDIQKSAPENFESVYVCRPCYSAISRRADVISKQYFDRGMQELRNTEARLQMEIAEVRAYASMRR